MEKMSKELTQIILDELKNKKINSNNLVLINCKYP